MTGGRVLAVGAAIRWSGRFGPIAFAVLGACMQSGKVCAPNAVWAGDTCVARDCADFAGFTCERADGGIGICTSGACLDLTSDPANCGSYGFACPSGICHDGSCWSLDGGYVGCQPPRGLTPQMYSPSCVLQTCSAGTDNQQCLAPPGSESLAGFCCHGACTTGDDQNCGGCGISCGAGAVCADPLRGCLPAADCASADPGAACRMADGLGGICCGFACVAESLSSPGTCNGSFSPCTGTLGNESCIDFMGRPGQCCGDACIESGDNQPLCGTGPSCHLCLYGQACLAGACVSARPGPEACGADGGDAHPCFTDAGYAGTCCGSVCVDLDTDPLNCRYCGVACSVGDTCSGGCNSINGCGGGAACPAGYECAGNDCLLPTCNGTNATCLVDGGEGMCCGDRCVQPSANGLGCGECGSTCPAGSECFGYYCSGGSAGGLLCGPAGKPAAGVGPCPAQTICSVDQCFPILDCSAASRAPGNTTCIFGPDTSGTCCGSGCVATEQDPSNCGACGVACASGICAQGQCLAVGPTDDCDPRCGPGTVCLNGGCIGSACGFNAGVDCLAEDGTIGVCCGTGVCAHLRDDASNCGACGNACVAGQVCNNGVCSGFSGCPAAEMNGFCNLDAGTTYACCPGAGCTNLLTDPANCGYCGEVCLPGQACADGTCV